MGARRSLTAFTLVAGLWLCGSLSPVALAAQPFLDSVPSLDIVRQRLGLTDAQHAQLLPIFERRLSEIQMLQSRLEQPASNQEKRKALQDARRGADTFNSQVERVLSASQKGDWRELRDEARKKVKERSER